MKTIDLIYFNAGGGHRAAALALQEAIRQQGRPWHVRLVNLFEVLDPNESFRKFTGLAPEDLYNLRLKRGWTFGLAQELKVLQAMIAMRHVHLRHKLSQHWLRTQPDLVVSLIPNFNRALCESLSLAMPGVPFATVLTDMADYPPHFWIEHGLPQHLVCGTPRAAEQARLAGYGPRDISLVSGMILHPSFYGPSNDGRAQTLRDMGLDPTRLTGVVMFGGHGSAQMLSIAKALHDVQLILICGHNTALAAKLNALYPEAPHAVLGFTREVSRYMALGDFFIGKPGPGSLSEAVHMGLPVITMRNAWTMPQERYNTQWVMDTGVGLVLRSMRGIRPAVAELIDRLQWLRANVRRVNNRAVFEVPQVLADLLARRAQEGTGQRSGEPVHCDR